MTWHLILIAAAEATLGAGYLAGVVHRRARLNAARLAGYDEGYEDGMLSLAAAAARADHGRAPLPDWLLADQWVPSRRLAALAAIGAFHAETVAAGGRR